MTLIGHVDEHGLSPRTRRRANSFERFLATSAALPVSSTVIRSSSAAHRTIPFEYGTSNVARVYEFSRGTTNSCGVFASIPNASCLARTMVGERNRPCCSRANAHRLLSRQNQGVGSGGRARSTISIVALHTYADRTHGPRLSSAVRRISNCFQFARRYDPLL